MDNFEDFEPFDPDVDVQHGDDVNEVVASDTESNSESRAKPLWVSSTNLLPTDSVPRPPENLIAPGGAGNAGDAREERRDEWRDLEQAADRFGQPLSPVRAPEATQQGTYPGLRCEAR